MDDEEWAPSSVYVYTVKFEASNGTTICVDITLDTPPDVLDGSLDRWLESEVCEHFLEYNTLGG